MTEAEAKTKWCPFARVVASLPDSMSNPRNRVVEVTGKDHVILADRLAGANCIGPACMAWRWDTEPSAASTPDDYRHATATISWGDGRTDEIRRGDLVATGYCGLAGQ